MVFLVLVIQGMHTCFEAGFFISSWGRNVKRKLRVGSISKTVIEYSEKKKGELLSV